jgi:predicted NAD/FAD-binding protein
MPYFTELDRLSKNSQISNIMEILPVGAKVFHEDGRTGRYDEVIVALRTFA